MMNATNKMTLECDNDETGTIVSHNNGKFFLGDIDLLQM